MSAEKKETESEVEVPYRGVTISAQSYKATHAPYPPSNERQGEWRARTQHILWDSENIVTPFKPTTLGKTSLQCTEGQHIMVTRST